MMAANEVSDMPDLVSSDEDDAEELMQMLKGSYVNKWINEKKRLNEEDVKITQQALGPFLFGFGNVVSEQWIQFLHQTGCLALHREKTTEVMTDSEMDMAEFMQEIIHQNQFIMKDQKALKDILELITEVEKLHEHRNDTDVLQAVEVAMRWPLFTSARKNLEKINNFAKHKNQAPVCLLYLCKIIHDHVVFHGKNGVFLSDKIMAEKEGLNDGKKHCEILQLQGSTLYEEQKFQDAVTCYTKAVEVHCLDHLLYGKRAQAYLQLKKYREAWCDSKRALVLDPKFSKGYYQCAEACLHLDWLDKARLVCGLGMNICNGDSLDITEFQDLESKILKALKDRQKRIRKESENDIEEKHKTRAEVDDLEQYRKITQEGLEAMNKGDHIHAYALYQAAYDLWGQNPGLKSKMKEEEVTILRYACAVCAINQCTLKMLQEGLELFLAMMREKNNNQFPLVYLGTSQALRNLYRFADAIHYIEMGLQMAKKCKQKWQTSNWPGSQQIIPESKFEIFQKSLMQLYTYCCYPPAPDAVCAGHVAHDNEPAKIYFCSPSFAGYVRVTCHLKCRICFHHHCWKEFKSSVSDRHSDKELVNQPCPTPDCGGVITRIFISRGTKTKELASPNQPLRKSTVKRTKDKMDKSTQQKMDQKKEKRELRRRKRKEAQEAKLGICINHQDDLEPDTVKSEKDKDSAVPPLAAAVTLLRKDEDDIRYQAFQKQVRAKKKKEKIRHVLNLDINFTDGKEDTLLGEHSIPDDHEEIKYSCTASNIQQPFQVPSHVRPQLQNLAQIVAKNRQTQPPNISSSTIIENLLEYFAGIFNEHGPLRLNSPILIREFSQLPKEAQQVISRAGGPGGFFRLSLKFVVIDDIVANIKDTKRAHEMSRGVTPKVLPLNAAIPEISDRNAFSKEYNINGELAEMSHDAHCEHKPTSSMWSLDDFSEPISETRESLFAKDKVPEQYERNFSNDVNVSAKTRSRTNKTIYDEFGLTIDDIRSAAGDSFGRLNPGAPVFQPKQTQIQPEYSLLNNVSDDFDDIDEEVDVDVTVSFENKPNVLSSSNVNPDRNTETPVHSTLDDLDDFMLHETVSKQAKTLDDIDAIDDLDVHASTHSPLCLDKKQATDMIRTEQDADCFSRRSSKSDLSDFSTGILYRASSPASSVSSHKTASMRDLSSPQNSTSPISFHKHRKTDSPMNRGNSSPLSFSDECIKQTKTSAHSPPPHPYFIGSFKVSAGFNQDLFSQGHKPLSAPLNLLSEPSGIKTVPKRSLDNWHPIMKEASHASSQNGLSALDSSTFSSDTLLSTSVFSSSTFSPSSSVFSSSTPAASSSSSVFSSSTLSLSSSSVSASSFPKPLKPLTFSGLPSFTSASPFSSSSSLSESWANDTFPSSIRPDEDLTSSIRPVTLLSSQKQKPDGLTNPTLSFHSSNSLGCTWPDVPVAKLAISPKVKVDSETQTVATPQQSVSTNTEFDLDGILTHTAGLIEENNRLKQYKQSQTENLLHLQRLEKENTVLKQEIENFRKQPNKAAQQTDSDFSHAQVEKQHELGLKASREEKRANAAEVELVQLRLQFYLQLLDWREKEAKIHQDYISYCVEKFRSQENGGIPVKMKEAYTSWQNVLQNVSEKRAQVIHFYEGQISKVQAGIRLTELPSRDFSPLTPQTAEGVPQMSVADKIPHKPKLEDHRQNSIPPYSSLLSEPKSQHFLSEDQRPSTLSSGSQAETSKLPPGVKGNSFSSLSSPVPKPLIPAKGIPLPLTAPRPVALQGLTDSSYSSGVVRAPLRPLAIQGLAAASSGMGRAPSPQSSSPPSTQHPTMAEAVRCSTGPRIVSHGIIAKPQPAARSSFDKLVVTMQKNFPECTREDFTRLIQELRRAHGGSLSGMPLENIISRLSQMAVDRGFRLVGSIALNSAPTSAAHHLQMRTTAPPPGLNPAWSVEGIEPVVEHHSDHFQDEDPCAICHDDLSSAAIATLDCRHQFHDQCIRQWFREQNTCPTCRTHTLLQDEFPTLLANK